jgi:hypothetical protein
METMNSPTQEFASYPYTMQDPSVAIHSVEASLRMAIHDILGDSWKDKLTGENSLEKLEHRREEERKRRPVAPVPDDLLEYVYTHQLKDLILKNWEPFSKIFGNQQQTSVFLKYVVKVRDSIAHSRGVTIFERDLISGIAGHIRSLVSNYRQEKDRSSSYYPLIEEVIDSWGTKGVENARSARYDYYYSDEYALEGNPPPDPRRLHVGEVITFQGSAGEIEGLLLNWSVARGDADFANYRETIATGPNFEFNYTVTEDDIGEDVIISIILSTNSEYHRHNNYTNMYDDSVQFLYIVEPPHRNLPRTIEPED